ncbi:hypothetical protein [Aquimarina macrocephali]|uniref:hypothetical protein n=1 Tax=Aquimarina macrocephali TaxID=666563 RepID=UPI003F67064B
MKKLDMVLRRIAQIVESTPEETHEEYLKNLEKYKNIIDKTPNNFLKYHLDDQINKEHFELAEYIITIAFERGFSFV